MLKPSRMGTIIHHSLALGLLMSAHIAIAQDLLLVGLREDPSNQSGEEALMELVSLSNGVSRLLCTFRVPGVMGSGSVVSITDNALAYFADTGGPGSGQSFSGTKVFRILAGRTARIEALTFSDRFLKKMWTSPRKHEELYVHVGGSVSGIGPPVADLLAGFTWIDLRPLKLSDKPEFFPGSGACDSAGRVGSPGAAFEGPLGEVITLRDVGLEPTLAYSLPSRPTNPEAGRIDGGYLVRSPAGSLAIVAREVGELPHGTKYHVFVYAHKNSKWIAEIRSLSYLPAPFFLQEGLVLIPEMQEVDIPGTPQKQYERTGRFTVVDMDSGNARTLNLNGGTPIRAIGGDIVVLEPYTGKAQRVLKVSWDISTAEVLYVTSGDWWQGYCLDSDVRTESFTLSAPQEANP